MLNIKEWKDTKQTTRFSKKKLWKMEIALQKTTCRLKAEIYKQQKKK